MAQVQANAGVAGAEGQVQDPPPQVQGLAAGRGGLPQAPLPGAQDIFLREPMTPEQITSAISEADSDLVYLWEQGKGLPLEIQARFAVLGFTEMAVFSKLADTAAEVRLIAQNELGLREDLGIKGRALVGRILTCWEAAQSRLTRKHNEEVD